MQMLYNSDNFVVVQFDVPAPEQGEGQGLSRGGYEIVDKHARREIFIEGLLAESFKAGVQELAKTESEPEVFDEFISGYCVLAQNPVTLH